MDRKPFALRALVLLLLLSPGACSYGQWDIPYTVGGGQIEDLRELPPPIQPSLEAPATASPRTDPNSLDPNSLRWPLPPPPDYTAQPQIGPNGPNETNMSTEPSNIFDIIEPSTSPSLVESLEQPVLEVSPIEEQHKTWYQQYPWMWLSWPGWTNSIEVGLNGSEGNSRTTSVQAGADLQRITDVYTFAVDLDYQRTQAAGIETQNNGRLDVAYDHLLGGSSWTAFAKSGLEYDQFKAFDLRLIMNGGLGYYWLRNDRSTLITRFGSGTSREFGGPNNDWVPEAVFGYEASHQLTERQKIKGRLEYFPEWTNFNNYRMVSDVSWEVLLDGTDNLSLKLAATNRYDSTPEGAKPNDLFYSALLLWKF